MLFVFAFGVDEDVIKVHYHKNVKLFCQNLIDVVLKHGQCIDQSKKYHLVLKMAIASFESHFSLIAFPNTFSIVGIGPIKLGEMSSQIYLI